MDIHGLDAAVQELFSTGLAPSTRQNYKTGTKRYLEFCRTQQVDVPFPTAEHVLSRFVAWLHIQNLSCSTIKNYLAAVRHSQIAVGLGDPKMGSMVQLEYIIRGAKRTSYATRRTRLPISPAMLQGLRMVWQVRVNDNQDPKYVVVRIKASKTDPFRQGVSIYLGRTHNELYPVAAVLSYMVQRGDKEGPFRSQESSHRLGLQLCTLCWSQLPHRGGDNSCSERFSGLPHQDSWAVGECSVHGVYPDIPRGSLQCG